MDNDIRHNETDETRRPLRPGPEQGQFEFDLNDAPLGDAPLSDDAAGTDPVGAEGGTGARAGQVDEAYTEPETAEAEAAEAGEVGVEEAETAVLAAEAPQPDATPAEPGFGEPDDRVIDFSDIETPDEFARPAEREPEAEPVPHELPPAIERDRATRPPVVPRVVWIVAAAVTVVLLFALGAWAIVSAGSRVTAPNVVGVSVGVARTRLAQAGLEARVEERRFSARPQGEVLSQDPAQGAALQRGDVVSLVLSAGTEELAMPDVIGDGISFARGILEESGLVVVVEPVASEAPSDTVVSTTPAPGVIVRSGDVVRVQIASPGPGNASLQPYRMQGLSFTIDPAPVPAGDQDITLDVARRLRSLLEASGSTVVVLRSGTETGTTEADRASRARATNPTAALGISVARRGTPGRSVLLPPLSSTSSAPSAALASAISTEFARSLPPTVEGSRTADAVLGPLLSPWVRVRLGSLEDAADVSSFKDPRWADQAARALYKALGEVYGSKEDL